MDNLLSGLGKFGIDEGAANNLFEDANVTTKQNADGSISKEIAPPKEEDFLLLKAVRCPICDGTFRTIQIKSGRAKRKEPDMDLRPRFEYIDTNKYDITSCPKCGFAFNEISSRLFSFNTPIGACPDCSSRRKLPDPLAHHDSQCTYVPLLPAFSKDQVACQVLT